MAEKLAGMETAMSDGGLDLSAPHRTYVEDKFGVQITRSSDRHSSFKSLCRLVSDVKIDSALRKHDRFDEFEARVEECGTRSRHKFTCFTLSEDTTLEGAYMSIPDKWTTEQSVQASGFFASLSILIDLVENLEKVNGKDEELDVTDKFVIGKPNLILGMRGKVPWQRSSDPKYTVYSLLIEEKEGARRYRFGFADFKDGLVFPEGSMLFVPRGISHNQGFGHCWGGI